MAATGPIPTRFDQQTAEGIAQLVARTGLSQSEIIRRLVSHALKHAQETGDITFLFNNPRAGATLGTLLSEKPHTYTAKTTALEKADQALKEARAEAAKLKG